MSSSHKITDNSKIMEGEHNYFLGNPHNEKDRQWADAGGEGYHGGGNIVYPSSDPTADIFMVPDFQGESGQGSNQSTHRPIGSV